jgi:aminoglycoside phosphotransferase (APT) family kinase protein
MNISPVQETYPSIVARLLGDEHLQVKTVYRDGPRYWVGRVTRDGADAILKVVVDHTPWTSPGSDLVFEASDQLRSEIILVDRLHELRAELHGLTPNLIKYSIGEDTWMLRQAISGRNLAAGTSPFIFSEDIYKPEVTEAVINFIASYQNLTAEVSEKLTLTPHSAQNALSDKMRRTDLGQPTELLEPYAAAICEYLLKREELHDSRRDTLAHGQVYPPHIYVDGSLAGLIDWENASLNNPFHDLAGVWIRGISNQAWQVDFIELLARRGMIRTDEDREMWRVEVLLQAAGNLNYLYWSQFETAAEQTAAIASLKRHIEEVLSEQPLGNSLNQAI